MYVIFFLTIGDFDDPFNVEKMKGEIDADFSKCNADGTDGLTWKEVSDCKVSQNTLASGINVWQKE